MAASTCSTSGATGTTTTTIEGRGDGPALRRPSPSAAAEQILPGGWMLLRRVVAGWPGGQGTAGIGLGGSAGGDGAGLGTDGGGRPPRKGVHGNRGWGDMDLAPGDGRPPRWGGIAHGNRFESGWTVGPGGPTPGSAGRLGAGSGEGEQQGRRLLPNPPILADVPDSVDRHT